MMSWLGSRFRRPVVHSGARVGVFRRRPLGPVIFMAAALAIVLSATAWPRTATAATYVALVTDLVGTPLPRVETFEEVPPGTLYDLGKSVRMTFMLFARCQEVTIEGGTILFTREGYQLIGGKVINEAPGDCPQRVELGGTDSFAGVVFRGEDPNQEEDPDAEGVPEEEGPEPEEDGNDGAAAKQPSK